MTASIQKLQDEFLQLGIPSSPASVEGAVLYKEFFVPTPNPVQGAIEFDELLKGFADDEEFQNELVEARKEMAKGFYANEPQSFSSLRLRAGLSQSELASRAGTSQPHIARIEAGRNDPGTETVQRIANALGVDVGEVFNAIRYQLESRGKA